VSEDRGAGDQVGDQRGVSRKISVEGYEEGAEVRVGRCARAGTDFGWLRSRIEWETGTRKMEASVAPAFSLPCAFNHLTDRSSLVGRPRHKSGKRPQAGVS
jgi:hypothetical protein